MVQIKSLSLQEDLYFPFWGTKVCFETAFKPLFLGGLGYHRSKGAGTFLIAEVLVAFLK